MRADAARVGVYVVERSRFGYFAWALSADGVQCLALPSGSEECDYAAAVGLAWTLLFDATGDGVLADDWCEAFAAEVLAEQATQRFTVFGREVLAWLNAS